MRPDRVPLKLGSIRSARRTRFSRYRTSSHVSSISALKGVGASGIGHYYGFDTLTLRVLLVFGVRGPGLAVDNLGGFDRLDDEPFLQVSLAAIKMRLIFRAQAFLCEFLTDLASADALLRLRPSVWQRFSTLPNQLAWQRSQ